jgi:hypothetical protein
MPFEEGMPYTLDFPANEVGSHEKVCLIVEYAFSRYMPYIRVDCTVHENGIIFTIGRSEGAGWCAVKGGNITMPYHSIIFLKDTISGKWILPSSPRNQA